jgi:hypothetical protein
MRKASSGHLTLDERGELELESLGEDTEYFIREVAYPILNKVQVEMISVDTDGTDAAQKLIAEAVANERVRLWPENDTDGNRWNP